MRHTPFVHWGIVSEDVGWFESMRILLMPSVRISEVAAARAELGISGVKRRSGLGRVGRLGPEDRKRYSHWNENGRHQ